MCELGTSLSIQYPKWAVDSKYHFQDLLCVCLECYGPNVVLLDSVVPVRLSYLPVWGFSYSVRNVSCCITYSLHVTCTHKRLSIPHVELQESAHWKYTMLRVWVTKSMEMATGGDYSSRCSHHLGLQLPLSLSLILLGSSLWQWIFNNRAGFCIRDGGMQIIKTTERSGSATNAGCWAGYYAKHRVCLYGSTGSWCVMATCTRHGVVVTIICGCVADRLDVTSWVISAMRQLFREDEGVEFWPSIVEGMKVPPREEFLSPACTETHLSAGGRREFAGGRCGCQSWRLARFRTFCTTAVLPGEWIWDVTFRYRCSMLRR